MRPEGILYAIGDAVKYLKTWRKRRLYQQWVERAGLPPEAVPRDEPAEPEDNIPGVERQELRLPTMIYVLLVISIIISCTALIMVSVYAC